MIICIGREFGSGGHEIGRKVAEKLGLELYDRDLIDRAAEKIIAMPKDVLEKADEKKRNPWLHEVWCRRQDGLHRHLRHGKEMMVFLTLMIWSISLWRYYRQRAVRLPIYTVINLWKSWLMNFRTATMFKTSW